MQEFESRIAKGSNWPEPFEFQPITINVPMEPWMARAAMRAQEAKPENQIARLFVLLDALRQLRASAEDRYRRMILLEVTSHGHIDPDKYKAVIDREEKASRVPADAPDTLPDL
jgi:hypothetical protein